MRIVGTTRRTSNPYRHIKREGGKRSGLETQVAATLTLHECRFKGEKEIDAIMYTNQLVKKYHPDFELANGIIIECKGWFKVQDRTKHLCIKAQHPELDIRFVFSNPNAKIGKESKTSYAMWCEKYGFKYAKGKVPEAWIDERKKCAHVPLSDCHTYKEDYDNLVYVCPKCNKTIG